eukprot:gene21738-28760_t
MKWHTFLRSFLHLAIGMAALSLFDCGFRTQKSLQDKGAPPERKFEIMTVSDASAEAVSGAMGSVIALLGTYPLKTIYTSQALSAGQRGVAAASALDIIRRYKLSGLYVGIGPNVVESALSSGVYFYLYSRLRALAVRLQPPPSQQGDVSSQATSTDLPRNAKIGVLSSLLVAAVAGAGNQLCTMPASVVATRMLAKQKALADADSSGRGAASKSGGSMLEVISEIYNEGGMAAFWTGFIPSLILVANPAIQYMLYEQLLELFRRWKRQSIATPIGITLPRQREAGNAVKSVQLSAMEYFIASALAKVGATVATYPLIVVKSRMQAAAKVADVKRQGTVQMIAAVFQDEGADEFFKGMLKEQFFNVSRTSLESLERFQEPLVTAYTALQVSADLVASAESCCVVYKFTSYAPSEVKVVPHSKYCRQPSSDRAYKGATDSDSAEACVPPLALPAPGEETVVESKNLATSIDVSSGQTIKLDHLGPLV